MRKELAARISRGREAIALARRRGLDIAEWQSRLNELFAEAGRKPAVEESMEPWMLWEWRRISIPEWRRILVEAIECRDRRREDYARWMLRDILLDPDYTDEEGL